MLADDAGVGAWFLCSFILCNSQLPDMRGECDSALHEEVGHLEQRGDHNTTLLLLLRAIRSFAALQLTTADEFLLDDHPRSDSLNSDAQTCLPTYLPTSRPTSRSELPTL